MGLYGDLGREQDRRFAKAERPEGTQGMSKSEGLAKVRLAVLRGLFLIYLLVLSLIFSDSGICGHFRGARSGVYILLH